MAADNQVVLGTNGSVTFTVETSGQSNTAVSASSVGDLASPNTVEKDELIKLLLEKLSSLEARLNEEGARNPGLHRSVSTSGAMSRAGSTGKTPDWPGGIRESVEPMSPGGRRKTGSGIFGGFFTHERPARDFDLKGMSLADAEAVLESAQLSKRAAVQAMNEMTQQLEAIKATNVLVMRELDHVKKINAQLVQDMKEKALQESVVAQAGAVVKERDALKEVCTGLEARVVQLQEELEGATTRADAAERRASEAADNTRNLHAVNEDLQAQLDATTAERGQQLEELQSQLAATQATLTEHQSHDRAQQEEFAASCATLEMQLQRFKSQLDETGASHAVAQAQLEEAGDVIENMRAENAELLQHSQTLAQAIAAAEVKSVEGRRDASVLRGRIAELEEALESHKEAEAAHAEDLWRTKKNESALTRAKATAADYCDIVQNLQSRLVNEITLEAVHDGEASALLGRLAVHLRTALAQMEAVVPDGDPSADAHLERMQSQLSQLPLSKLDMPDGSAAFGSVSITPSTVGKAPVNPAFRPSVSGGDNSITKFAGSGFISVGEERFPGGDYNPAYLSGRLPTPHGVGKTAETPEELK